MNRSMLVILDGWGIGPNPKVDAIVQARTPYFDKLMESCPNGRLITYGEDVGLPEGQMGNSEVGHLNIGAGRVVYQELARINKAIRDDTLKSEKVLTEAIEYARDHKKPVHVLGLVSDGGVHSHTQHIIALAKIFDAAGVNEIFVHAFMDGRDTDPKSGKGYITEVQEACGKSHVKIASIIGRYYAMDRDQRWERIKKAYDLLVHGKGTPENDPVRALQASYDNGITDEFIEPIKCIPGAVIKPGDLVVFANFRTDRPRQLVRALTQETFEQFDMHPLDIYMVTMTNYDDTFTGVRPIFDKKLLDDTLGAVLEGQGLSQVRIAETEKYPHVTFFFSGGREKVFDGEKRILVPSPKVATYDLQPEMSADEVTRQLLSEISDNQPHFICLNYANADMVGHTGDFDAAVKACETVDNCLKLLLPLALKHGYEIIIIADHGNSDYMVNEDGSPNTAHTTNPVPVIYTGSQNESVVVRDGRLADVAPTLLQLMGIEKPSVMTGKSLITYKSSSK